MILIKDIAFGNNMGVKDLFKYLIEADVFVDTSTFQSIEGRVLVDFNSFFYACMYSVKTEADLPFFPHIVATRLNTITTEETVFFVDKGDILAKNEERTKRKNREVKEIDLKILEEKVYYENEVMKLLGCHPDIIQCYPDSNHELLTQDIIRRGRQCIVYANRFDAEYAMVKLAMYMGKEVTLVSNDQDTIALSIINMPYAKIIYQGAYYQLIQDEPAIRYAQLITYVTMLCNKSDYFNGLEQITAKTFLNTHIVPYSFDIHSQAVSDKIISENEHLMTDLINAIKKPQSRSQYIDGDDFSIAFSRYVISVSRFLTLDTSFFLS